MFRIFKNLKWFFKREWLKYIIIFAFTFIYTYIITLPPKYLKEIIDEITNNSLTKDYVYYTFGVMLFLAVLIYISAMIKRYFLGGLFHKLFYNLKNMFLNSVFRQDSDFFEEYYSGDLITRATGDTNNVSRVATHLLFALIDTIVMLIISSIKMFQLDVKLTLLSIIPLPIILIVVLYIRPKISANWKLVRKEVSHLNNLVMESVANVKLVRGFVKEEDDFHKLEESATNAYVVERKSVLLRAIFSPVFRVVTLISQGIALLYGSRLIMNNTGFTIGSLLAFNMYLGMFANPLFRLGNQITVISQSGIAMDRIDEILQARPTLKDGIDAKELINVKTIEFKNLSFKYPNDSEFTIQDINLKINSGQTIGIVGKTGSGKSTLIKQLLRGFPISEGNVYFNDKPINKYKKESVRFNIAYVPQEHQLFSRTVLDNIKLGTSINSVFSIDEVIKMADFEKDIPFLQDGLKTIVGEAGVTLSGGQKQRLSIARALLKNSEVLILDDSLSAVDGMTESNILRNLKEFRDSKTNIIVAHRLTAVEDADIIIVMDHGKIVERGTHQELMENKKWYHQQYLIQQMEDDEDE